MKKIKLLIFGIALFLLGSSSVNAQVGVSINLDLQPQWGPVEYDYVDYYYMPEYDIYYYAPQRQFIYQKGNRWITVSNLPYQYRHVNLFNTYKVVINEPQPYLRNEYYAAHYKQYKGQHSRQLLIRDSKDERYERHHKQPAHWGTDMEYHGKKGDKGGHHKQDGQEKDHQGRGNNKD